MSTQAPTRVCIATAEPWEVVALLAAEVNFAENPVTIYDDEVVLMATTVDPDDIGRIINGPRR